MTSDAVAIIGTRGPDELQKEMAIRTARVLSYDYGFRIRTGGAFGIDHAAMVGTKPGLLDVYLPWAKYNQEIIPSHANRIVFSYTKHSAWRDSVERYHPNPKALSPGAYSLMARNYPIICDVRPVRLVLALPDVNGGGGTGQGIRIARDMDIPLIQHDKFRQYTRDVDGVIDQVLEILGLERKAA